MFTWLDELVAINMWSDVEQTSNKNEKLEGYQIQSATEFPKTKTHLQTCL